MERARDLRLRQGEQECGNDVTDQSNEEQWTPTASQHGQVAQRDGQEHDHRDAHAIRRDLGAVEVDQPPLDQDEGASPDQGEQRQREVLNESVTEIHVIATDPWHVR